MVSRGRCLVLTAMIFAVAMMSIDQTIVSIAAPTIQRDRSLTATGLQWVINGYLLALAAFFALGGKVSRGSPSRAPESASSSHPSRPTRSTAPPAQQFRRGHGRHADGP